MSRDEILLPASYAPEAPRDCARCDRLVAFRSANKSAYPAWFNGAVPSFGASDAKLLIVGLAPGLKGANRTGRPFTGRLCRRPALFDPVRLWLQYRHL